jgi:hypothetical protein
MNNETIAAPEQTSNPADGKSVLNDGLCVTATQAVELERQQLQILKRDAYEKLLAAEQAWYKFFCASPLGREREQAADVYENVRCATRI